MTVKFSRSEEEWKKALTPEQFRVLREKGTERPFTGRLLENKDKGVYRCAGCGQELFPSDSKYDSGSGWPSFSSTATEGAVERHEDRSLGIDRTEILCSRCGGHLGHVFEDGPAPTGLRYCVNSEALDFKAEKKKE